jgi:hypothetical protein
LLAPIPEDAEIFILINQGKNLKQIYKHIRRLKDFDHWGDFVIFQWAVGRIQNQRVLPFVEFEEAIKIIKGIDQSLREQMLFDRKLYGEM